MRFRLERRPLARAEAASQRIIQFDSGQRAEERIDRRQPFAPRAGRYALKLLEGQRCLKSQPPDTRSPQRSPMRPAAQRSPDVVGQYADIGSFAGVQLEHQFVTFECNPLQSTDGHAARLALDLDTGARERIERASVMLQ